MQGITLQAVHRTTNKMADALDNAGVKSKLEVYHSLWNDMEEGKLKEKIETIHKIDLQA